MYAHNTLKTTLITRSETECEGKPGRPEFLMYTVQQDTSPPILVCVAYRPPHIPFRTQPNVKSSQLLESLKLYCGDYSHKIIMGDLNANVLKDIVDARFVRNLVDDLSLQIVDHGATHRKNQSRTWIDFIFVDDNDDITDARNLLPPFRSNHNILDVELNIHVDRIKPENFSYRDYKGIAAHDLVSSLQNCDWSTIASPSCNVNEIVSCLTTNLQNTINTLAPLKHITPRNRELPWVNADLKQLYRKRDATRRRYDRTKNTTHLNEFLKFRDLAENHTDEARTEFYNNRSLNALESNNIWNELRNLGLLPKPKNNLNGFSLDELNNHFAGVSISGNEDPALMDGIIETTAEGGFSFSSVTISDVELAVVHFSSQARGSDEVPQSVVAKSLPVLGPILVNLFNKSLLDGVFPDKWKEARVIPLKKKAVPSSASDFRPIARLCFLSKVLEKIVHAQLMDYLSTNNLLDPYQAGFRRFHSTETALLKVTDDIRTATEKKHTTFLLLFDFSKAFDTISPSHLVKRLQSLGFSRTALL